MAVVVKYVVVRNGEEKMTFATKKEADAHDRMLDIADNLYDFIGQYEPLTLDDDQREAVSLYLAKNSDQVINIMRGMPVRPAPPADAEGGPDQEGCSTDSEPAPAGKKKGGKSKSSKGSDPSNMKAVNALNVEA